MGSKESNCRERERECVCVCVCVGAKYEGLCNEGG